MPKRVSNTRSSTRVVGAPQARQTCGASGTGSVLGEVLGEVLLGALVELGVDQEAEPERLQHEEDQPGTTIEKAQPHDVAIEEQQERAQEPRQPVVAAAQRA